MRRTRRAAPRARIAAATGCLLVTLACSATIDLRPSDASLPAGSEIRVIAGIGTRFESVDGRALEGRELIAPPGRYVLGVRVRRSLQHLGFATQGVVSTGHCEVEITGRAGDVFEIRSEVPTTDLPRARRPEDPIGVPRRHFEVEVVLEDRGTGRVETLPWTVCELRLDCRDINRNVMFLEYPADCVRGGTTP